MTDLITDIFKMELLIRIMATSIIVVIVTTAVGKLGPLVGGLLAGLPIGLGPGFYFLLGHTSEDFLIRTVTFSLLALSATQVFLISYIVTAKYGFPIISLLMAVLVWVLVLLGLNRLPVTLPLAISLFAVVTFVAYRFGQRFRVKQSQTERKERFRMLLLRALFAGLLVALVTTSAPKLGGALSGILLAFPIGYALISITVHEQYGAASVISVLHSALLGTIGLATFCVTFAICLQLLPELTAFAVGLAASIAITSCMMFGATVQG
ncbi:MAG: hypothetical protein QM488_13410 [Rhizobiaceae bacterium]